MPERKKYGCGNSSKRRAGKNRLTRSAACSSKSFGSFGHEKLGRCLSTGRKEYKRGKSGFMEVSLRNLAGREGKNEEAIRVLSTVKNGVDKTLLARLLKLKGDAAGARWDSPLFKNLGCRYIRR